VVKQEYEASLSRDGSEVAFVRRTTDVSSVGHVLGQALFVVSSEGGTVQRLIGRKELGTDLWDPTWAPDGTKIAFSAPNCGSAAYEGKIDVINSDGTQLRRLQVIRTKERDEYVSIWPADWSPDGQRLLSIVTHGLEDCGERHLRDSLLYVTDLAGGAPELLARTGYPWSAHWSPDGSMVAYSGAHASNPPFGINDICDFYVVGLNGGRPRHVASLQHSYSCQGYGTEFVWDPSGDSLIFGDGSEVDRVNVHTGRRSRVIGSPPLPKGHRCEGCRPVVLAVSPDGRTLVVEPDYGVYLVATDGTRVSPVVEPPRSKNVGEGVSSITLG
jgi:Tol biopolymer transport system component